MLRYDLRTVPAFVATGLLLDGARNAALAGTQAAWVLFALTAATTIVLTWAATRYLGGGIRREPRTVARRAAPEGPTMHWRQAPVDLAQARDPCALC